MNECEFTTNITSHILYITFDLNIYYINVRFNLTSIHYLNRNYLTIFSISFSPLMEYYITYRYNRPFEEISGFKLICFYTYLVPWKSFNYVFDGKSLLSWFRYNSLPQVYVRRMERMAPQLGDEINNQLN